MASQRSQAFTDEEEGTRLLHPDSPEAVLHQLERLVNSVHFRNSKRYPAFLRFVVEQTLLGRTNSLKERTLGIEVFGRSVDYDTNTDPVVRVTAGEIRKRIAQYYQAPDHEHEMRIELPLGSYIPHFLPPHGAPVADPHHSASVADPHRPDEDLVSLHPEVMPLPAAPSLSSLPGPAIAVVAVPAIPLPIAAPLLSVAIHDAVAEVDSETASLAGSSAPAPHLLRSRPAQIALLALFVCLLVLGTVSVGALLEHRREAGLSFIWGPILRSREQATIVLGVHSFDTNGRDLSPATYASLPLGEQTALASMIRSDMVPVSDVISYSEIVGLLAHNGTAFRTQSAAETNIEQLRHGPLIFIGGFDNIWTMRLTSSLRFRLVATSETVHEIQDTEIPHARWGFDNAQSALSMSRDYAIVARFLDPQTEQHVLVVAGIGKSGTEAAADFVTDARALKSWTETSSGSQSNNVEIVLSTDIIEGRHGPAHVLASCRW